MHTQALGQTQNCDIAILNGRVMDPESGLDRVSHVCIINGSISTITNESVTCKRVIDAIGFVVAPGFINLTIVFRVLITAI